MTIIIYAVTLIMAGLGLTQVISPPPPPPPPPCTYSTITGPQGQTLWVTTCQAPTAVPTEVP